MSVCVCVPPDSFEVVSHIHVVWLERQWQLFHWTTVVSLNLISVPAGQQLSSPTAACTRDT